MLELFFNVETNFEVEVATVVTLETLEPDFNVVNNKGVFF